MNAGLVKFKLYKWQSYIIASVVDLRHFWR